MSKEPIFTGTGVAMVTPFESDGKIDFKRLEKHTDQLIKHGIDYLVALGTTAETPVLSKEEKLSIIDAVKSANAGRVPVVVGAGGNSTQEVISWIRTIGSDGIDGLLSVVPYYNKPSQTGIKQHFSAIASASDLPVLLYNVPGRTGTNMTADTTLELANEESDKIVGVKEASGDFTQIMNIISEKPTAFHVISGDDAIAYPMITLGGSGVISVIGNALPGYFSDMVNKALEGKYAEARKIHYKTLPFVDKIFKEGNPTGIKALMEILGFGAANLRLPLIPASKALTADLKDLAESL